MTTRRNRRLSANLTPTPTDAGVAPAIRYQAMTDGLHRSIARMLAVGTSIRSTARYWGVSRATVRKVQREVQGN